MEILKIISRLMDYPSAELQPYMAEMEQAIARSREISPQMREQLKGLVRSIYGVDVMDAQELYTGMFDRGRSLSLLLFEHVHGESRDRGQAMVDLMGAYEKQGFEINVQELPDYIPLYLEYLSQIDEMDAREGLADVSHILGLLAARLRERESNYATLFEALLMISGAKVDVAELQQQVAGESRDDTPEALDKIWEEEAVTFGAGDNASCPSSMPSRSKPDPESAVPVRWANG